MDPPAGIGVGVTASDSLRVSGLRFGSWLANLYRARVTAAVMAKSDNCTAMNRAMLPAERRRVFATAG